MYLTCVEHDFSFDVITLLIHHIHLLMELSAEILCICVHNTQWMDKMSFLFKEELKSSGAGLPAAAEGLGRWC